MRRKRSQVSSSLQLLSLRTIKRYNYRNDARRMDGMENGRKEVQIHHGSKYFYTIISVPVYRDESLVRASNGLIYYNNEF